MASNHGIDFAKKYIGLYEIKDRDQLMSLFKKYTDIAIDPSTTSWCAAFVNLCEKQAGNPGTNSLAARSFMKYGVGVESPKSGDIAVFSRGNSSWQGHVAYFIDLIDGGKNVKTLGGNQGDCVCYAYYPVEKLLGYRRYEKN